MRELVAFVHRLRAVLAEAAAAIERGDLEDALAKFDEVDAQIKAKVTDLRAAGDGEPV